MFFYDLLMTAVPKKEILFEFLDEKCFSLYGSWLFGLLDFIRKAEVNNFKE